MAPAVMEACQKKGVHQSMCHAINNGRKTEYLPIHMNEFNDASAYTFRTTLARVYI